MASLALLRSTDAPAGSLVTGGHSKTVWNQRLGRSACLMLKALGILTTLCVSCAPAYRFLLRGSAALILHLSVIEAHGGVLKAKTLWRGLGSIHLEIFKINGRSYSTIICWIGTDDLLKEFHVLIRVSVAQASR